MNDEGEGQLSKLSMFFTSSSFQVITKGGIIF
jgi:hypothetical protein